ncbi:hypothetical protein [Lentibacter sp.]|uniref:hypothetical protein n=1 Tax=Lentibacter sp. TaxID=2024994 RepID=UPI003F6A503F
MKRVCLLGNSHIGAFLSATRDCEAQFPASDYAFDCFGSIRASIQHVTFEGTQMTPTRGDVEKSFETTSGGKRVVELEAYDTVIIALRNTPFWIRPYLAEKRFVPLSRAVVQEIYDGFLDDWSVNFARNVASAVPDTPVVFLGRPLNSEQDHLARSVLGQLNGTASDGARALKDALLERIEDVVLRTVVADNLRFLRPPAELLEPHGLFTKSEYSRGAVKFRQAMKAASAADDTQHMNGEYGLKMLKYIL